MSHQCQRHTGIERGCRYLCSFCDAGSNSERNFRTHTIRKHAQYATPPRLLGSYVFQYRPGSCLGIVVSENRLGEPCEVAARVHNSNGVPGIFFVGEFAEETLEGMNVAYNIAKQLHTERYGPQFFEQTLIDFRVPPEDVRLTSTSTTAAAFMAMYSLAVPRCVRMDTIISACVEPDGSLAPVGLLSQKVLGAVDFGVRRMILSSQNVNHVLALPEEDKRGMEFIYVANCEEILERMF
uniref:Lon proteolytic domain-containing protein n=1 Tax=Globodera pallida TaxID=36090 RepID=A0A183BZ48_GLOPA